MKKIIVAVLLFVAFVIPAFAEETVPPPAQAGNGAYSYNLATGAPMRKASTLTATGIRKAVERGLKSLTGKNGAITEVEAKAAEAVAEAKKTADAVQRQGGKLETIDKNVDGARSDIRNLDDKLTGKNGAFAATNANIKDMDSTLFWVFMALFVLLVVIGIASAIWFFSRRRTEDRINNIHVRASESHNVVANVQNTTNAILTEVNRGFAEMRTSFTELPQQVANAVNTLDESPIEFEAGGHLVTYRSPIEGIREGYYLKIHVPEGATGDVATYERATSSQRGVVRRESKKTMEAFFAGKFDTTSAGKDFTLQKALLQRLNSLGELTWRTI